MNSLWFKDCKSTLEKDKRKQTLFSIDNILGLLRTELEKKLTSLQRCSIQDYNNQNWALLEADRQGQYRVLQEVIQILTITKED